MDKTSSTFGETDRFEAETWTMPLNEAMADIRIRWLRILTLWNPAGAASFEAGAEVPAWQAPGVAASPHEVGPQTSGLSIPQKHGLRMDRWGYKLGKISYRVVQTRHRTDS